jgi:hypothetical protein
MLLTKEQILAVDDLKKQLLEVPEWGGAVYIRVMNGLERDKFEEWASKSGATIEGIRARIASLCIVDVDGNRIFSDADADALCKKSGAALDRICSAIKKLNAVSDEDIKELAGN